MNLVEVIDYIQSRLDIEKEYLIDDTEKGITITCLKDWKSRE